MTDNTDTEYCKIENLENSLKISIYFEGGYIKVLLNIWVLAWIGVEILIVMDFVTNMSTGFQIAWTILGGLGSFFALWSTWGKEVIEVSSSEIVIHRTFLGMGSPKAYLFENICGLSIETHIYSIFPEGETPGKWSEITFEYKSKRISFGRHRDQQELNQILDAIVRKFPQYEEKVIFTKF